jgi:Lrp/AsnC family transcriptional regulator for asnA, asnC and gidA
MNIDNLDLEIMKILQIDGRKSFRDIASILNKPESTIRSRYNQLIDNKALKVVAIPEPKVVGLDTMVIICLKMELVYLQTAAEKISKFKEVRFVACTSGGYDLILQVYMKSNDELVDFITNKLSKIDGIKEYNFSIELKLFKSTYDWLNENVEG